MSVLIAADHVVEDGIHVLAQQVLIVVLNVEGFLVRRSCLFGVLLYFELDFQVFLVNLVPAVLGDAGRKTVHSLQFRHLFVSPSLEIAVEIGL